MKCKNVQKDLVSYYYKDLPREKIKIVEEHLRQCQSCHEDLAALEKTLSLASSRKTYNPGEEFWQNYNDKILQRLADQRVEKKWTGWVFTPLYAKLVPVLAGILLIISGIWGGIYYGRYQEKKKEEIQIVQNLDLLQDLEVLQDLELLENLGELERVSSKI